MYPGLQIRLAAVVGMVGDGMTDADILDALPDLAPQDPCEGLGYAAEAVRERELPLVKMTEGFSSTIPSR